MRQRGLYRWFVVACVLAAIPVLAPKVLYPGTIKAVPSPDGKYVAAIRYTPAFARTYAEKIIDLFGTTASHVFATVQESSGRELRFWVPLDLSNDAPADYQAAGVRWISDSKVSFSSIRGPIVVIDVLKGSVETSYEKRG